MQIHNLQTTITGTIVHIERQTTVISVYGMVSIANSFRINSNGFSAIDFI
jgi:hypothetical protein